MVELKLFDGSVICGCLRKTQDETFKGFVGSVLLLSI